MKTALITTTINIPKVLELYRARSEDVRFFVTGDMKSDSVPLIRFCRELGNTACYDVVDQNDLGYKCSELIGWNTIARRNIALLEALKWGADIIATIDDDNIPLNYNYFVDFEYRMTAVFNGIQASSALGWFDVGTLLDPVAPHRGFPHDRKSESSFSAAIDKRVGVAAGICLGDPDVSACTRIATAPIVHRVSELLRAGIVVDPAGERRIELEEATTVSQMWHSTNRGTWTIFNSQNTSVIRELAPAFFMFPQYRRFDDILASLTVQRIMREKGYVTHFGQPFVLQQRNQHDLLKDLSAEQWGSEHILEFAQWLDSFVFTGKERVTDCMRIMYSNPAAWMPKGVQDLALAWADDCDAVLS